MVERGALTETQARQLRRELEGLNYETQTIPVTEWEGEQVLFIAYKPKPGARTVQPPVKPTTKPRKDPVEEFRKIFWKEQQPSEACKDDGTLMDPSRAMMVIRKGASSEKFKKLIKLASETVQNSDWDGEIDYEKLLKAGKIGRIAKKPVKYVSFNVHCFPIRRIKQALKVLGVKKAKAYLQYGKPLVVQNDYGDSVIIAETIVDNPAGPDVVSFTTVNAL